MYKFKSSNSYQHLQDNHGKPARYLVYEFYEGMNSAILTLLSY